MREKELAQLERAMSVEKPTINYHPARVEHRRSKRFLVVLPAEVKWHGPGGVSIKENAQAEEVNAHGGLLRMETYPKLGDIIELTNLLSTESAEARVLAIRRSAEDMVRGVAVELHVPSETFWGMNFQQEKNTAELFELGQALGELRTSRQGSIDETNKQLASMVQALLESLTKAATEQTRDQQTQWFQEQAQIARRNADATMQSVDLAAKEAAAVIERLSGALQGLQQKIMIDVAHEVEKAAENLSSRSAKQLQEQADTTVAALGEELRAARQGCIDETNKQLASMAQASLESLTKAATEQARDQLTQWFQEQAQIARRNADAAMQSVDLAAKEAAAQLQAAHQKMEASLNSHAGDHEKRLAELSFVIEGLSGALQGLQQRITREVTDDLQKVARVEPKQEKQPVESSSSGGTATPLSAAKVPLAVSPALEDVRSVSFLPEALKPSSWLATPAAVAEPKDKEQPVKSDSSVRPPVPISENGTPVAASPSFDDLLASEGWPVWLPPEKKDEPSEALPKPSSISEILKAAVDRLGERVARARQSRRTLILACFVALVILVGVAGIILYRRHSRSVAEAHINEVSATPRLDAGPHAEATPDSGTSGTQPQSRSQWRERDLGRLGKPTSPRATSQMRAGKLTAREAMPAKVAVTREEPPRPPVVVVGEVSGSVSGNQAGRVLGGIVPETSWDGLTLAPPPKVQSPEPVGGRVQPPRLLSSVLPVYPVMARQARLEGDVTVQADIDTNGHIVRMKVISGPLPFRVAAMDALRQWKYEPSRLNDQPVPAQLIVTIKFRIK
jgi:TonB family protein